jgi:microcompartment protein CcmL/EutN
MNNPSDKSKHFPAICLIEFNNIADGITAADAMTKKAPISMLKSGTISQGKYLVLIGGSTASVRESFQEGMSISSENVVDSLFLPDIHQQVYEAILGNRQPCNAEALGIIETGTVAATIQAADAGVKGARVHIVEIRLADGYGGKGYTLFNGKVEDVEAALEIGLQSIESHRIAVFSRIISALHPRVSREIESSLRFSQSENLFFKDGEKDDVTG